MISGLTTCLFHICGSKWGWPGRSLMRREISWILTRRRTMRRTMKKWRVGPAETRKTTGLPKLEGITPGGLERLGTLVINRKVNRKLIDKKRSKWVRLNFKLRLRCMKDFQINIREVFNLLKFSKQCTGPSQRKRAPQLYLLIMDFLSLILMFQAIINRSQKLKSPSLMNSISISVKTL